MILSGIMVHSHDITPDGRFAGEEPESAAKWYLGSPDRSWGRE